MTFVNEQHRGPICGECGQEFYYDLIVHQPGYEESGLCEECWRVRGEKIYREMMPADLSDGLPHLNRNE